jgi:integrase/recombinase XerC
MSTIEHPLLERFQHFIRFEKRFSIHTIRAYSDDLTTFFRFVSEQFDVQAPVDVTPAMVRSWMASLSLNQIQPRSINRKLSSLNAFFRFGLTIGELKKNPVKASPVLKVKKRLPAYIEKDKMERLLRETGFPDDFRGRMEYLIVSMLYQTGMRVSELVGLKETHLDLNRGQIKVLGKGSKERIIPVHPDLVRLLSAYLTEKKSRFPGSNISSVLLTEKEKPPTARQIYDVVKRNLGLVTTAERRGPHVLRHSFATHLAGNGAELNAVKDLLGHASLAATQVYTHNSIERLRDIHHKAHPKG